MFRHILADSDLHNFHNLLSFVVQDSWLFVGLVVLWFACFVVFWGGGCLFVCLFP